MTKTLNPASQNQPSVMALALVSVVTALVTIVLVFALILPSAYGIDPLGWGANLGIAPRQAQTRISTVQNASKPASATAHITKPNTNTQVAVVTASQIDAPLATRQETVELTIPPKQSLDYRLAMERDYDLDYTWTANGITVYSELRGEPKDGKTPSKTFAKLTSASGKGFFIIPFNGQFGWHWQNKTDQPVTIRLTFKGAYQVIGQVGTAE